MEEMYEQIIEIRLPINSRDIILDGCCDREHQNGSHGFYVLSICKSFRSICFFCIWQPCLGGDSKTLMLMAWDWSGGAWRRDWRNLCFDFLCFLDFKEILLHFWFFLKIMMKVVDDDEKTQ